MEKLVLISGISGAGKTACANILEDMGYVCIDSYPSELLQNLIDLLVTDQGFKYRKVAITTPLNDLEVFYRAFINAGMKPVLLLIDAKTETIINRYKFTRRVHPLLVSNNASTLLEAVEIEKAQLEKYKHLRAHIIDTSTLSIKNHKEILDKILNYDDINNLSISFVSFGYKYGIPDDADMVFDVRILKNPYYVEELKSKNGNDPEVSDYVLNNEIGQKFIKKLEAYINFVLKAYSKEEKHHLTVCVGCTGGQHRSVSVANYLYEHYKEKNMCTIYHRELKEQK